MPSLALALKDKVLGILAYFDRFIPSNDFIIQRIHVKSMIIVKAIVNQIVL